MSTEQDLVHLLGTRFVARKDVKAVQSDDGAWYPDRSPMTMRDFQDHLTGARTLGHYLLDQNDNCKFFAFDIDLAKHSRECLTIQDKTCKGDCHVIVGSDDQPYKCNLREMWHQGHEVFPLINPLLTIDLRAMSEGLARAISRTLGIPVAIATSGHKGLHVYGFTELIPAEAAKKAAIGVLEDFGCFEAFRGQNFWRHTEAFHTLEIEVFPKQTTLEGKDLGNLMKIPLGVHRVTGSRTFFIKTQGSLDSLIPMDPFRALNGDLPWE